MHTMQGLQTYLYVFRLLLPPRASELGNVIRLVHRVGPYIIYIYICWRNSGGSTSITQKYLLCSHSFVQPKAALHVLVFSNKCFCSSVHTSDKKDTVISYLCNIA